MARSITVIPAKQTMIPDEGEMILCKKRVAAYCRVSTDDIEQALSIHMQRKVYSEKIKANPDWIHVGAYVDECFSGTNTF